MKTGPSWSSDSCVTLVIAHALLVVIAVGLLHRVGGLGAQTHLKVPLLPVSALRSCPSQVDEDIASPCGDPRKARWVLLLW